MGFRNIIVGSGFSALTTAIVSAAHGPVLLLVRQGFRRTMSVRIDSLPSQTIAALIELGVDPRKFSDLRRHHTRLSAWSTTGPVAAQAPETVHVERGTLEAALYERVIRHPRITLMPAPVGRTQLLAFLAQRRLRGAIIVDASGRAAVLARERVGTPEGWQAWTVTLEVQKGGFDEDFRIATTRDGYGYRLGMRRRMTLGHVSFRTRRVEDRAEIFAQLRCEHAFLLDGLAQLDTRSGLRVYPAALQFSSHESAIGVGDANLARDALSSQGLACATSDAHYASAVSTHGDAELLMRRVHEQRAGHLRSLRRVLAESRYAQETGWVRYRQHVSSMLAAVAHDEGPAVALRHEGLRCITRHGDGEPGRDEDARRAGNAS